MEDDHTERAVEVVNVDPKNLTFQSLGVKKELPRYWDKDHINATISQIGNQRDKMFCIFLWMSGVRVSEAINITKGMIDFGNHIMKIRWLKNRKYRNRAVPIHPELKQLLEVYTAGINLEDRVFPFTRQTGFNIVKRYFNGHPHQLRHSFAVNWLLSGGDIVILHRLLGHSKLQTTMEYLKIVPVDQGKELLKIKFR